MNEPIKTIIVRYEEAKDLVSIKDIFREKLYTWIDEEYDKGWFIETLKFNFYNKDEDTNQYCDVIYRAKQDPIHLELLERLKIGL